MPTYPFSLFLIPCLKIKGPSPGKPLRPSKHFRKENEKSGLAIRNYYADKKSGKETDTNTLILVVLAILLPPVAVYLYEQETNTKFWITLLLFLLGIAGAVFFSWLLLFAAIVFALLVVLGAA